MPDNEQTSFDLEQWLKQFVDVMNQTFPSRIVFLGIQGSRARGEATDQSDIDVVVILDRLDVTDLTRYREAIAVLPEREKMCGFISGKNEILQWDKSDLFQFCYDTRPLVGSLKFLTDTLNKYEIRRAIVVGAGNIYHAVGHNFVHERDNGILLAVCKAAVFVMQAEYFFVTDIYLPTKKELRDNLGKEERAILDDLQFLKEVATKDNEADSDNTSQFQACSTRLLVWSSRLLQKYAEPFSFTESTQLSIQRMARFILSSRNSICKKFRDLTDCIKTSRRLGMSQHKTFHTLNKVVQRLEADKPADDTGSFVSNRRLCDVVMKSLVPNYCGEDQKPPIEIQLPSDFRKKVNSLTWNSVCLWSQAIVLAVLASALVFFPLVAMTNAGWSQSTGINMTMCSVIAVAVLATLYYELYFKLCREKLRRRRIALAASSTRETILACLYARQRRKIVWRRTSLLILSLYVLFVIVAVCTKSPVLCSTFILTILPAVLFYLYCVGLRLDTFFGKVLAVPAIAFALPFLVVWFFG